MKIGVYGPVFLDVNIDLEGKFYRGLVGNKGNASVSISSRAIEAAIDLSKDHEVYLFTAISSEAACAVLSMCKQHNISTKYVEFKNHGLGFNIYFNDPNGEVEAVTASPDPMFPDEFAIEAMQKLDVLIFTDLSSPEALTLHRLINVPPVLFIDPVTLQKMICERGFKSLYSHCNRSSLSELRAAINEVEQFNRRWSKGEKS